MKDGRPLPEVNARFTYKEYQNYFRKKRESTQSGAPIHIGHHKAASEDVFLSTVNALFINTPFRYGFTLDQWTIATQCMLQKKDRPLWNKLRIITLFDAGLNAGSSFFFATTVLFHSEDHGVTDSQHAGSKPERTTYDPLYIQTLTYDLSRLQKNRRGHHLQQCRQLL